MPTITPLSPIFIDNSKQGCAKEKVLVPIPIAFGAGDLDPTNNWFVSQASISTRSIRSPKIFDAFRGMVVDYYSRGDSILLIRIMETGQTFFIGGAAGDEDATYINWQNELLVPSDFTLQVVNFAHNSGTPSDTDQCKIFLTNYEVEPFMSTSDGAQPLPVPFPL